MLTVLISLAMVFSALAVLSLATQPAFAASGTVTYDPTVYTIGATAVSFASGGTFGAGSTVYFFLSVNDTSKGIIGNPLAPSGQIGSVTLAAGQTALNNVVSFMMPSTLKPGTYYILAEDASLLGIPTGTFTGSAPITLTTLSPSITLSPMPGVSGHSTLEAQAGSVIYVSGSGFDKSSTISIYFDYAGSSVLLNTTGAPQGLFAYVPVTVPTDYPNATYAIVAQESSGSPNLGITADAMLNLAPSISVSPMSISGSTSSSFTITGYGFPSAAKIPATTSSVNGIELTGPSAAYGIESGAVASANGQFTLSVTGLKSPISSHPGAYAIVVYTVSNGTFSFPNAIYVSVPYQSPTLLLYDLKYKESTYGYPGDPLLVTVIGFPPDASVNVNFDGTTIALTTDVNGFGQVKTAVPYIPGNSYHVFAASQGISASANFEVLFSEYVTASNGVPLDGQYAAAGSTVTINVAGASPYEFFDFNDTGLSTFTHFYRGAYFTLALAYLFSIINVTITNGSFYQQTSPIAIYTSPSYPVAFAFEANANGVLTLKYSLTYLTNSSAAKSMGVLTGTSYSIISINHKPGAPVIGSYRSVTDAVQSGLKLSYAPKEFVSFDLSSLLPPTVTFATPETVAWEGPYALYIDGVQVAVNGNITFKSSPGGTAVLGFTIPSSITDGVHTLTVVAESGTGATLFTDYQFIVSSGALSIKGATVVPNMYLSTVISGTGSSGSPFLVYPDPASFIYEVTFNLYDFPANSSVTMTYYNNSGAFSISFTTDSNGAASIMFDPPYAVGNIPYNISFTVTSGHITAVIATYYYEDVPAASFIPTPFLANAGSPLTDFEAGYSVTAIPGDQIPIYLNSLLPNTYYNVYLSTSTTFTPGQYIGQVLTGNNGNVNGTGITIPSNITTGTYYIDFAPAASSTDTAVVYLTVEVTQLTLENAFPGQPVNIGPIVYPLAVSGTVIDYKVTVYLNGTAYKTVDVVPRNLSIGPYMPFDNVIYVSFNMPNGNPGNWYSLSLSIVPEINTTVTRTLSNTVVGQSSSSWTVAPSGTFLEYGTATVTFPTGTTSVLPTGIFVSLTPSSGNIVYTNNGIITGYSYSSGTLTVDFSITFTLEGANKPTVMVKVTGVTVTYTAAATGTDSDTFEIGPQGSYYGTGSATFTVPSDITVTSVDSYTVSLTASNGIATVNYITINSFTQSGNTVTFSYTIDFTVTGDSGTSPVTVSVTGSSGTVKYSGKSIATSTSYFAQTSGTSVTSETASASGTYIYPLYVVFTGVPGTITPVALAIPVSGSSVESYSYVISSYSQSSGTFTIWFNLTVTYSGAGTATLGTAQLTYEFTGAILSTTDSGQWYPGPAGTYTESGTAVFSVPSGTTSLTITSFTPTFSLSGVTLSYTLASWTPSFTPGYTTVTIDYTVSISIAGAPVSPTTTDYIVAGPPAITYTATSSGSSTNAWQMIASGTFTEPGMATFTLPSGITATSVSNLNLTLSITSGSGSVNLVNDVITSWSQSGRTLTVDFNVTFALSGVPSGTVSVIGTGVVYSYAVTSYETVLGTPFTVPLQQTVTLIQGNGAYIMGITSGDIAELVAAVNSSVTSSMQVPLKELNAAITSLNGTIATITTKFGTMFATLSAINASVSSIASGQATVVTDLGTVETSLANLNATVLGISNNAVLLNTSIGQVKTTLNAINANLVNISNGVMTIQTDAGKLMVSVSALNANITAVSNGVATIQTSLGTIQASLNSLNAKIVAINGTVATIKTDIGTINTSLANINAQLTSIQGNVATIQTSLGTIQGTVTSVNGSIATIKTQLGTLQTSVNGVTSSVNAAKSSTSNAVTFEVLIMVLVLITLVIAIGSLLSANRMVRRLEELKKQ